MATAAQIAANRLNAQKSTGPRTAEGKAVVSQNAVTHGLLAREGVLRGEDGEEFEMHRERLMKQLSPVQPLEEILATRIVDLTWRLKRAVQDQKEAFAALYDRHTAAATEPGNAALPSGIGKKANQEIGGPRGATLGRILVEDFSGPAVLERLLRYERRIESSLYRSLTELRRVHDQCQKADREVVQTLERWQEEDVEARKTRAFACWGPADCPEGVSSLKCEVPGEVGRGRPTHEEPPDGGSTNSPPVESTQHSSIPSFQDSSHTPGAGAVLRANRAKQTQSSAIRRRPVWGHRV